MNALDIGARGLATRALDAQAALASPLGAATIGTALGGSTQDALDGYASRAEIKALPAADGSRAYLVEKGREGHFVFRTGDHAWVIENDPLEGVYLAPDSDPSGASGAWERIDNAVGRPEWFGGAADFDWETGTGTDNAPAINACLAICWNVLVTGVYGVASPIRLTKVGQCIVATGLGNGTIYALQGFEGAAVVSLEETRCSARYIWVNIPETVYDPATQSGTPVDGFATVGDVFHDYLIGCRSFGGRRGFHLGAGEAKVWGCHAEGNYDGFYVDGWDTSVFNISASNNVNFGCCVDGVGLEGRDIHLVRSGQTALVFNGAGIVMLDTVHVDTPTFTGIELLGTSGAMLNSVYFTKMGEGRAGTATDVIYIRLANARGNILRGGYINVQNPAGTIDTTGHYFLRFADTSDDRVCSIENTFENFDTQDIAIAKFAPQKGSALAQRWKGCRGSLSKLNNEGLLYRSDNLNLAPGASTTLKMWLSPEIDTENGSRLAVLTGEWVARATAADRAAGRLVVPVAIDTDFGAKDGVVTTDYATGAAPTIAIADVAFEAATRVLTLTVTNTGAATIQAAVSLRPPLDNHGLL